MMHADHHGQCDGFFLPGARGDRFCLFHPPDAGVPLRGAIVYLHPFAEEMNCARRTAVVQARALAMLGFGVLQIDLAGCGDSACELREVRWQTWRQDVVDAAGWLRRNCSSHISLWGLRLGALLALDCCHCLASAPEHLLLWQPVLDGRAFLNQFLRLGQVARWTSEAAAPAREGATSRAVLEAGQTLEIGGYEISPSLASSVDGINAADHAAPISRVGWLEVTCGAPDLAPSSRRQIATWRTQAVDIDVAVVQGPAFWSSHGHDANLDLLGATERLLRPVAA